MLPKLFMFVHIVTVSARNVYYEQSYSAHVQSVPSYRDGRIDQRVSTDWNDCDAVFDESGSRQREVPSDNGYRIQDQRNNKGRRVDANTKGIQRTEHVSDVITNEQYAVDVKYIERLLKTNRRPDTVIFHGNVNYDRQPFTNERRPEDNVVYSTGSRQEPVGTPENQELPNRSETRPLQSSNSNTSIDHNKGTNKYNKEETSDKNRGEETTTLEVDLEDRVAFTGDACATGYAKIQGKCVKEQK
ncbi:unnamed protein product, partial [Iphiclides podalirius]